MSAYDPKQSVILHKSGMQFMIQVNFLVFNNMIGYTFTSMNKLTYMTKFRLNKAMLFVLVTAMLSMQWSLAHIHLAEHHEHDGSHHQHNIEAHTHKSFTQIDNFTGSNYQVHQQEVKVVELGNDCNVHSWNNFDDQPVTLTSVNFQLNLIHHSSNIELSEFSNSKQRYIDYSTINLRAPPKFS